MIFSTHSSKMFLSALVVVFCLIQTSFVSVNSYETIQQNCDYCKRSIYSYTLKDLMGNEVSLSKYYGHISVIVNYASTCLYTYPNMKQLSKIAEKYEDQGLKIIFIPSNSFHQNFGGNEAAKKLAKKYPKFDVYAEVYVSGKSKVPLYTFLTQEQPGFIPMAPGIKWNFTKFVIDKCGCVVERFEPAFFLSNFENYVKNQLNQASQAPMF